MAEDDAVGSRVVLRELTAADEDEFLGLARASVGLHHPWYTMPTTPEAFGTYLTRLERPSTEGRLVCVRWAITVEMTDIPVVNPHPSLPAR